MKTSRANEVMNTFQTLSFHDLHVAKTVPYSNAQCALGQGFQNFLSEFRKPLKLLHNSSRARHLNVMWLFWNMLCSTKSTSFSKFINFSLLAKYLCWWKWLQLHGLDL